MFSTRPTIRHGLIVGLIAYAAVAVFYATLDVLAARSALFTVDMLGKAVFRGLRDPSVLLVPRKLDLIAILIGFMPEAPPHRLAPSRQSLRPTGPVCRAHRQDRSPGPCARRGRDLPASHL